MKNSQGFTLVEVVIVLAILSIGSILGVVQYGTLKANQALTVASETLRNNIEQAHVYSREAKQDKSWGVKQTGIQSYQLLSRSSPSDATPMVEKNFSLLQEVSFVPPPFEIWFDKGTGNTLSSEIELSISTGNKMKVSISNTGAIDEALIEK